MTVKELIAELEKVDGSLEVINYEGFEVQKVEVEPIKGGGNYAVIY